MTKEMVVAINPIAFVFGDPTKGSDKVCGAHLQSLPGCERATTAIEQAVYDWRCPIDVNETQDRVCT